MLDEVVVPWPLGARGRDQPGHGVELVVAREDQGLALHGPDALGVLDLLLTRLQEDVGAEDVEEALAGEHVVPEVVRLVPVGVRRVPLAAVHGAGVAAPVEGQEARTLAGELRRHVDFFGVGREVDDRSLPEAEERRVGVPVSLILADSVAPGLTGHLVLEFAGGDRHTVEREDDVDRVLLAGVARHLPRDREVVGLEPGDCIGIECVRRLEIREPEGLAVEPEAVAEYVQRPLEVQFLHQRRDDALFEVGTVEPDHLGPLVGLGRLDEGDGARREECPVDVPLGEVALPPADPEQRRPDVGLEGLLGMGGGHGELLPAAYFACVIILARRSSR